MANISSTTASLGAGTNYARKEAQTLGMSSRHAMTIQQAESAQTEYSAAPARPLSTYAHLAKGAEGGPSAISSQTTKSVTSAPENPLERMTSLKALIARHQSTNSYEQEMASWSERIRLDAKTGEKQFVNDGKVNQAPQAKTGQILDLRIKTKDGDIITLSINAEFLRSAGKSSGPPSLESNFSLAVAGTLSEEELEAVDGLVARLDDIAKAYQQHNWTEVEFSEDFDDSALAEFSLNIAGDNASALTIDYNLDPASATHTLSVDQNGYEYKLSADYFLNQTGFALQQNPAYQQYAQVLIDSTRSYQAGTFLGGVSSAKAVEFFLDGLTAVLSPSNSEHHETAITAQANANPEEKSFLSGLTDFAASFSTPKFSANASNASEVSQMKLTMEQTTEASIDRSSGVKTLTQSYSYDSQVRQHFGIGGDSMRHANLASVNEPGGQTYLYEVVNQSASLTRVIDISRDDGIIAYQEDKNSEHTETTKHVVNGEIEKSERKNLSEPTDIYSFALQPSPALTASKLDARIDGYIDIEILNDMINSQHIDLYS